MSKVNRKDTRTKPTDVVVVSLGVNYTAKFCTGIEIKYKQKLKFIFFFLTDFTMCLSVFIVDFEEVSANWEAKEGIDHRK